MPYVWEKCMLWRKKKDHLRRIHNCVKDFCAPIIFSCYFLTSLIIRVGVPKFTYFCILRVWHFAEHTKGMEGLHEDLLMRT